MTTQELVAKIAARAEELANLTLAELRRQHPDAFASDRATIGVSDYAARQATIGMTRGRIIADIITEEFAAESVSV
jgi:hypothetical protein